MYSERRRHAHGARALAIPLSHSYRVSWGPGSKIAFGVHSIRVADLSKLNGSCAGTNVKAAAEHACTMSRAVGPEPRMACSLGEGGRSEGPRRMKQCASEISVAATEYEASSQEALADQHVWKVRRRLCTIETPTSLFHLMSLGSGKSLQ